MLAAIVGGGLDAGGDVRGNDLGVRHVAVLTTGASASLGADLYICQVEGATFVTPSLHGDYRHLGRLAATLLVVRRDTLDAMSAGEPDEIVKETPS